MAIRLTSEQIDAFTSLSVPQLRMHLKAFLGDVLSKLPPAPMDEPAKIVNFSFKGPESEIPIRVYTPEGTGPFPAIVYYHGGGWVSGDLDAYDGLCRAFSTQVGAVVVSVDYRLAPEAKFPAAPEDAHAAFLHVHANSAKYNIEPERIAVAGDSAGGNLAIVTALMNRDRQGPSIKFQCLIYPNCDMTANGPHKQSAPSAAVPPQFLTYFENGYINSPDDRENPLCSPLKADLTGLPPAFLITCEHDILLEEGVDFVSKLNASGVPCEHVNALGLDHGFFSFNRYQIPAIAPYQEATFAVLKKALF